MKQFTLTLITKEPRFIDRIESDNLIHLLSQFQFILVTIEKRIDDYKKQDDEIPF